VKHGGEVEKLLLAVDDAGGVVGRVDDDGLGLSRYGRLDFPTSRWKSSVVGTSFITPPWFSM
jgi:hypothetical protein